MAEDPTHPQFGPVQEVRVREPTVVDLEFNCDTGDYAAFINEVGEALADHDNRDVVHGVPLLSKKLLVKPARWMRIKLVSDGHEVTLLIRDDNVYLEGFELETEDDEKKKKNLLYVFGIQDSSGKRRRIKKRKTARMFPNSTFLGYDHKYRTSMLGDDVVSNFAQLRMGKEFAKEAVRLLSTYDQQRANAEPDQYGRQTKEALAGLIFIFCEGARMDPQHNLVSGAWTSDQEASVTEEHLNYCWSWGSLSRLLQGLVLFDKDPRLLENVGISTIEGAARVLRLALNPLVEVPAGPGEGQDQPAPPGGAPGGGQAGQDQPALPGGAPGGGQTGQDQPAPPGGAPGEGQAGQDQPAQGNNGKAPKQGKPSSSRDVGQRGRPLVEVFSVRANNFPNVGTIAIFDGRRGQIIYEGDQGQTDEDSRSQGVLRDLALTGPYRAISAEEGSFAVTVEPYSGSDKDESNDDIGDKFWELKFVVPKGPSTPVIKSYITPGEGDGRQIIVSYAVLSDAVEATVQVELEMKAQAGASIQVYGEITARNPTLTLLGGETVVLLRRDKASKEPVICGSIVSLPLDRSILAAALGLELVIHAKLHASWPGNETTVDFGGEFHVSPLPDRHDVVFPVKIVSPDIYPIQEPSYGTRPSQGLRHQDEKE